MEWKKDLSLNMKSNKYLREMLHFHNFPNNVFHPIAYFFLYLKNHKNKTHKNTLQQ